MPDDDGSRATLVANERAKISAAYMNGLAIAIAVVGGLSPVLSGDLPQSAGKAIRLPRGERPPTSVRTQVAEGSSVMVSQIVLMLIFPIGTLILGLGTYWIAKRDLDARSKDAREP